MQENNSSAKTRSSKGLKSFPNLFAVLLIFVSILYITPNLSPAEYTEILNIPCSEVKNSEIYYIEDLTVAECYGYAYETTSWSSGKEVAKTYYIVFFHDADGQLCISSLSVNKSDAISDELLSHIDSATMKLDGFTMSGYFRTGSLDSDLIEYLNTASGAYADTMGESDVLLHNLSYEYPADADFGKEAGSERVKSLLIGGASLVLGGVLFVFNQRRQKAEAAKQIAANDADSAGES